MATRRDTRPRGDTQKSLERRSPGQLNPPLVRPVRLALNADFRSANTVKELARLMEVFVQDLQTQLPKELVETNVQIIEKASGGGGGGGGGAPSAHASTHSDGGSDEVDLTDLAGFPGSSGLFLNGAGAFSATGLSTVLDVDNSGVEIVDTTTETDLYRFTVPGGTIGANGCLQLLIFGDYANGSGSSKNYTPRLYMGSDVVWGVVASSFGTSSGRRQVVFEIWIANTGAQDANVVSFSAYQHNVGGTAGATSDIGTVMGHYSSTNTHLVRMLGGTYDLAVDTSGDIDVALTIEHSAAHALTGIISRYAILRKIA